MERNSPVREKVSIGILGAHCALTARLSTDGTPGAALQGAFAEHQVMLQKLSLKRRVVIVLVRLQEDLEKCDALIIPGGGKLSYDLHVF